LQSYGRKLTIAILRPLRLLDNRTTLCNKSEKWKSPGAKKRRPEFRDAL
jgi:hypothetical protein